MKKLFPLLLAVGAGAALIAYKIAKDKKTQVVPVDDDLEYDDEVILTDDNDETIEVVEETKEEVAEVVEDVKEEATEVVEEIKDKVEEVKEEVKEVIEEVKEEVCDCADEACTCEEEKKTDVA